jgi:hypothetical protein
MFFYKEDIVVTDPHFSNVSLLLKGEGSNGSKNIIDSSNNNLTATVYGNTSLSTAEKKYGNSSIYFTGNGIDKIVYPNGVYVNFGSSNFTIETWINPIIGVDTSILPIFSIQYHVDYSALKMYLRKPAPPNNGFYLSTVYALNNSGTIINRGFETGIITANQWIHIALVRNSYIFYMYVNGQLAATSNAPSYDQPTLQYPLAMSAASPFLIGSIEQYLQSSDPHRYNGYMDNFRITKGVARYTDNFTPPGDF